MNIWDTRDNLTDRKAQEELSQELSLEEENERLKKRIAELESRNGQETSKDDTDYGLLREFKVC